MLSALGCFILWFGWYGFNCGSTLAFNGSDAGKIATNTTLAAATGCIGVVFIGKIHTIMTSGCSKIVVLAFLFIMHIIIGMCVGWMQGLGLGLLAMGLLPHALLSLALHGHHDHQKKKKAGEWNVIQALNGVLAGLVSITAPCATVDEWAAVTIGLIGSCFYVLASEVLVKAKIDDPLNAFPVHGACGVWGCLAAGIFSTRRHIVRNYGGNPSAGGEANAVSGGEQFAIQLAGVMCIMCWVVANTGVLFWFMNWMGMLRVTEAEEEAGMDATEHGKEKNVYTHSFMGAAGAPAESHHLEDDKAKAQEG